MDGRDTLYDSKTTQMDKRVTECHENGQDSREDLKQPYIIIRHLGPAWPIIAPETGVCGDSSGRGSSLRSERNPGGKW